MRNVTSWIEQAQTGNREAFAAVYDRYARVVFLDLIGRLGSRATGRSTYYVAGGDVP